MNNQSKQGQPERPDGVLEAILSGMDRELNDVIKTGDAEQITAIQKKQLEILEDLLGRAFSEINKQLKYSGVNMKTGQMILALISDTNNIWITITGRSMLSPAIKRILTDEEGGDEKGEIKDKGAGYSPIILN